MLPRSSPSEPLQRAHSAPGERGRPVVEYWLSEDQASARHDADAQRKLRKIAADYENLADLLKRRAGDETYAPSRGRLADTDGMAERPSGDNPKPPASWGIMCRVAAKAKWIGTVKAINEGAAIEAAAKEFKMEAWRLIAVRRRVIP